jgi:hypothetical protein
VEPDVPVPPPPVPDVPVLLLGLTPPVVGPLAAPLEEPVALELLGAEAVADPLLAATEELVVEVVVVERAAP